MKKLNVNQMEAISGQVNWQCVGFMAAGGFSVAGVGGALIGAGVGFLFCDK